jgi:hypothetical protein
MKYKVRVISNSITFILNFGKIAQLVQTLKDTIVLFHRSTFFP